MYYTSWNEFESLCLELGNKILTSNNKYCAVICISRGGLLLGRILSGILGLPLGIISAKLINNKYVIDDTITCISDLKGDVLLVDDVFEDRGEDVAKKVKKLQKGIKNIDLACIFYKSETKFIPKYSINKIKDKLTIVFPYQEASLCQDYDNCLEWKNLKKKITKKKAVTKKMVLKKEDMPPTIHPRSSKALNKISLISKIKIFLVILIIVLFIYSLFLGVYGITIKAPTDEDVLLKLSENSQVAISSYKQYMIGEPFVNKMENSNDYVIIYESVRLTYDYYNDQVKSVFYITEIING